MCKNAQSTAANLMAAIEPTLKGVLSFTGKLDTPEGKMAIVAYEAALKAVKAWKNGTPAENAIALIGDFQEAFNALFPSGDTTIPENVKLLVNVILAGIETVIGVLLANSPEPKAPEGVVAHGEMKAMHQAAVIHETTAKVTKLVPTFKRSIWHSPAGQYASAWNNAVEQGGSPDSLKVL